MEKLKIIKKFLARETVENAAEWWNRCNAVPDEWKYDSVENSSLTQLENLDKRFDDIDDYVSMINCLTNMDFEDNDNLHKNLRYFLYEFEEPAEEILKFLRAKFQQIIHEKSGINAHQ